RGFLGVEDDAVVVPGIGQVLRHVLVDEALEWVLDNLAGFFQRLDDALEVRGARLPRDEPGSPLGEGFADEERFPLFVALEDAGGGDADNDRDDTNAPDGQCLLAAVEEPAEVGLVAPRDLP